MQKFQWAIVPPSPPSILGFQVADKLNPDAFWVDFFNGVYLEAYPRVIEAAVQEVGSGFNSVGVNFPGDYDEWDISQHGEIPADMVQLYNHGFGETSMPRVTFYTILCAFAERLLQLPDQPADWREAMQAALAKLRAKMAADAVSAEVG